MSVQIGAAGNPVPWMQDMDFPTDCSGKLDSLVHSQQIVDDGLRSIQASPSSYASIELSASELGKPKFIHTGLNTSPPIGQNNIVDTGKKSVSLGRTAEHRLLTQQSLNKPPPRWRLRRSTKAVGNDSTAKQIPLQTPRERKPSSTRISRKGAVSKGLSSARQRPDSRKVNDKNSASPYGLSFVSFRTLGVSPPRHKIPILSAEFAKHLMCDGEEDLEIRIPLVYPSTPSAGVRASSDNTKAAGAIETRKRKGMMGKLKKFFAKGTTT